MEIPEKSKTQAINKICLAKPLVWEELKMSPRAGKPITLHNTWATIGATKCPACQNNHISEYIVITMSGMLINCLENSFVHILKPYTKLHNKTGVPNNDELRFKEHHILHLSITSLSDEQCWLLSHIWFQLAILCCNRLPGAASSAHPRLLTKSIIHNKVVVWDLKASIIYMDFVWKQAKLTSLMPSSNFNSWSRSTYLCEEKDKLHTIQRL